MDDGFELPVTYKGEEVLFPAQLKQNGYTHQFAVKVYGQEVLFEPDEEQKYRAIIEYDRLTKHITPQLLQAIAKTIENILK